MDGLCAHGLRRNGQLGGAQRCERAIAVDLVAVLPDCPAVVPAVDRALNGAVMSTLVVVWRVSEACNLACGFCGYSREVVRPRASANEGQVRALGAALA